MVGWQQGRAILLCHLTLSPCRGPAATLPLCYAAYAQVGGVFDDMMRRLDMLHAAAGNNIQWGSGQWESEAAKINEMTPPGSSLRKRALQLLAWRNQGLHQRAQWENPPNEREVVQLVRMINVELANLPSR